jgi:uncharacterized protein DUF6600
VLLRAIVLCAASALLATAVASADDTQGVPPGVARISVVQSGAIVLTRSGKGKTQVAGSVNMPIFPGDYVAATDADTLGELQLDGYTAVRLSGAVQLRLVANDADTREVDLAQGLIELALLHSEGGVGEVVTPNIVVRASKPGNYRIWVSTDGQTSVTSRRGAVDLVTPHGTYEVAAGKTILVRGDADNPSLHSVDKVAEDAFDDFNHDRDRALFAALNENTNVPSDIAAYDNLDQYGHWADVSPYGESWIPNQSSDWAPYRDGSWTWGAGYGWTWVGNEPWGWLPYHYGSWFFAHRYGWCWYPPAIGFAPVWFPAFVAFFNYGAGPYGYGWVPLAPYETFYPWYPWYWGWYYPWPRWHRSFPAPPFPPPPHHRQGPIRMHPLATKYRNAAFGGASTLDSRSGHGGIKIVPIRFDPQRFTGVTIRRDPQPVSLPIEGRPVETAHHLPLSPHFNETERRAHSEMMTYPMVPSVPASWHEYSAPRGSVPAPSHPHIPVGGVPVQPVQRVPIGGTPAEPVVHGGSLPVNSAGGSAHGGQGSGGGNAGSGGGSATLHPPA